MKKFIIILGLALATSSLFALRNIPFSIKCYKCRESYLANKRLGSNPNTVANRCFKEEYTGHKPEGYCVYKCQHGHTLYVSYDTGDRK